MLNLIFVLTPTFVDKYLVTESSPVAHKILIELVCSAKHESFLRILQLLVSQANPKDENELFSCLDIFEKASDKAQSKLLDLTDSNQLRHRWVESCDAADLSAVVKSIASLAKKFDLLEVCSEKLKKVIEKDLSEKEREEFENL